MEVLDQNTPENSEVTESTEPSAQETIQKTEAGADEGNTEQTPAYEPNFGFKYAVEGSKQVEDEISEIYRPLIKDADTEKAIRELHEKAYGLDFVKSDRDALKEQYQQVNDTYTRQTQALQTVGSYIKNKDYDSAFEALNIPPEEVLNYALQKVQYHKMEPQQRAAYDQQIAERNRIATLELQNQELQQNYQQFAANQRSMEVDNRLAQQDVGGAVAAFDQRVGRPGAFREEVFKRGQFYALQGQDVPVEQAVSEVLTMVGGTPTGQAHAAPATQHGAQAASKPVIPNVTGKGTSPVKTIPRSIDDLKKIRAEMEGS